MPSPQTVQLFHPSRCELGEGPLWADDRLYFFDILGKTLHALDGTGQDLTSWSMGEHASAAGRCREGGLIIASETSLSHFDPATGGRRPLVELEADNPVTRSNDGRADRQGGFWIGTMGKKAEAGAGTIYRFYEGEMHALISNITIPNALCFSPDGQTAYFADSPLRTIYRWPLDVAGFPVGEPEDFYRHQGTGGPDGAIIDGNGSIWTSLWGGSGILEITPDGKPGTLISAPVSRTTCPALSPDGRIFTTSARQDMTTDELAAEPEAGSVFVAPFAAPVLPEPEVTLA
ncbi:SMP-30/gluconolactonase/LRE family protein [Algicella marina]|uniref:SMP-30/gluconolactonase/LRE family protein n=1 Tax=Algicella marina TaxID=2683284 RepID=A0A6P1T6M1_9RHOB|nr:SMP-30/gluconolactonase/LRE family protein [Algicella marina]QHQ37136.1 SMP-30/gluconolactonase/LRE family protein [Algicella marina]